MTNELVITRLFDAPRSLVFAAWTEAEHVVHWMAPRGFTLPFNEAEVRPGGAWRACMRQPNGTGLWLGGIYREVAPPERLVFTHAWMDADGRPGHETLVTVTFADRDGKTEMTFRQARFTSAESRDGHAGGWTECFDQLDDHLVGIQQT